MWKKKKKNTAMNLMILIMKHVSSGRHSLLNTTYSRLQTAWSVYIYIYKRVGVGDPNTPGDAVKGQAATAEG